MMHYAPKAEGSAVINRSHFLLNDSGGQYLTGTTDTTRTFPMGELTDEERLTAALALTAALPERVFTGRYDQLMAEMPPAAG